MSHVGDVGQMCDDDDNGSGKEDGGTKGNGGVLANVLHVADDLMSLRGLWFLICRDIRRNMGRIVGIGIFIGS